MVVVAAGIPLQSLTRYTPASISLDPSEKQKEFQITRRINSFELRQESGSVENTEFSPKILISNGIVPIVSIILPARDT